jgi:hypothetical protein
VKITLGAEPKKTAVLAGLALVAAYLLYTNFRGDTPGQSSPAVRTAAPAPGPAATPAGADVRRSSRPAVDRSAQEFRPSLKPRRPEERRDPATIDPALRIDLLAKLQNVKLEGGQRSLFEFSQPRPPKTPDVKILPKPGQPAANSNGGTPAAPKPEAAAAVKPPAPPITMKFFGFISQAKGGAKRAFFLDGEEIHIASEGDMIKKRFKVVRIGISSAVVEDTEHQHQQTLPLEEQPG